MPYITTHQWNLLFSSCDTAAPSRLESYTSVRRLPSFCHGEVVPLHSYIGYIIRIKNGLKKKRRWLKALMNAQFWGIRMRNMEHIVHFLKRFWSDARFHESFLYTCPLFLIQSVFDFKNCIKIPYCGNSPLLFQLWFHILGQICVTICISLVTVIPLPLAATASQQGNNGTWSCVTGR